MSAPSAARRCAWAIAAAGSRKRPPSENESGVTLRTPMTSGRFFSRRSRNTLAAGAESATEGLREARLTAVSLAIASGVLGAVAAYRMAVALRGRGKRVKPRTGNAKGQETAMGRERQWEGRSITDDGRQLLGALDPALHRLLLRQQPHQVALIGFAHFVDQVLGVAEFELVDGFDADGAQQLGIFPTDAFDPHTVGGGDPAENALGIGAGHFGKLQPLFRRFGRAQKPDGGANPFRLEDRGRVRPDAPDVGDRIRHRCSPLGAPLSELPKAGDRNSGPGDRFGADLLAGISQNLSHDFVSHDFVS